jgi:hypothetical protein
MTDRTKALLAMAAVVLVWATFACGLNYLGMYHAK